MNNTTTSSPETIKPLIILSGPPGAGKSTVAKELIATSLTPIACIEGNKFRSFIAKEKGKEECFNDFKIMLRSMLSACIPYARNGYETILDFSVPPWYLEGASKIAGYHEVPLHYIILKPSETLCASRISEKMKNNMEDYADFHEFYESFTFAERHTIADDESSAATIAQQIREGIDEGRFYVL